MTTLGPSQASVACACIHCCGRTWTTLGPSQTNVVAKEHCNKSGFACLLAGTGVFRCRTTLMTLFATPPFAPATKFRK
eukprot:6411422-Amphidinium_carterae.1